MAKLKSFEQYVAEKQANSAQETATNQEVQEASVVMDAVDPKSKGLAKLLKKNNVSMEVIDKNGPSGFPEVELTGKREDLETVLADSQYGWDDAGLAEYIEESEEIATVRVKSLNEEEVEEADEKVEEADEEVEEVEEGNAFGDAVRKAKEAGEDEFEFEGETYKVEEAEAVEEAEETEEVNENPAAAMAVASMLKEVYEACKNEAKAYEEDAHDSHTVESYMKENAALVATLAAGALKEMKDDYSTEAYEAACNEMVDAYTTKINEMKESDSAEDAEDVE